MRHVHGNIKIELINKGFFFVVMPKKLKNFITNIRRIDYAKTVNWLIMILCNAP